MRRVLATWLTTYSTTGRTDGLVDLAGRPGDLVRGLVLDRWCRGSRSPGLVELEEAMSESFTCPECGAVSYHPEDVRQGYCGRCHAFTVPMPTILDDPAAWHAERDQ